MFADRHGLGTVRRFTGGRSDVPSLVVRPTSLLGCGGDEGVHIEDPRTDAAVAIHRRVSCESKTVPRSSPENGPEVQSWEWAPSRVGVPGRLRRGATCQIGKPVAN